MACSVLLHGQAFSYALGGRAAHSQWEGSLWLRSTPAGERFINPPPPESKKKGEVKRGDVDAPWWSWRESNPRPSLPLSSQKAKGATGFKTSE